MKLTVEAACGCSKGRVRSTNEDNFCFGGQCLEPVNEGLEQILCYEAPLKNGAFMAVFDGMGGENDGEAAAFAAARQMLRSRRGLGALLMPDRQYLLGLTRQLNGAVVAAARERHTDRMGSTMAALYFSRSCVYSCNLGDSRAYRLREGALVQLSRDHVASGYPHGGKKPPLTQYLGIDPEELLVEPHIAGETPAPGDQYLLCSDGLTDMLTDSEICHILRSGTDVRECVRRLLTGALDRGGRDNVTAILCRLQER